MENIRVYGSIIDKSIKDQIKEAGWCADLMQYATYKCNIDGLLASACLFCPEIIQIENYIFIKKFWTCDVEESIECVKKLEEQYHNDIFRGGYIILWMKKI